MRQDFEEKLYTIIERENVWKDEPMKKHTTFRVGGPADFFVVPPSEEVLAAVIGLSRELQIPYYIIGNGSNLLVGDQGIRGVVIQVWKNMSEMSAEGTVIKAQGGCSLAQIAALAAGEALTGFEFAAGIPGTLGGAVTMNAGAYGGEMKDVLLRVRVLTPDGEILELGPEELKLGYRTSVVAQKGYIVLGAEIGLAKGEEEAIRARMAELREQRVSKQPLEYPSAGSTFKRPEGYFAGKLIQDAGLKGFSVGGAQVSEKHSGFVINTGEATAGEIQALMDAVIEKVKEDTGVVLEPEVKKIGEF